MLHLLLLFWFFSLTYTALGYNLVREYSGANFFNDTQGKPLWNFYGSWDNLTLYVASWPLLIAFNAYR